MLRAHSLPAVRPPSISAPGAAAVGCAAALAALAGPLASAHPGLMLAGLLALGLVTAIAIHPPAAAYVLLATTPLIVGIDRGRLIPLLRPSEAVLLLAAGTVLARALLRSRRRLAGLRVGRLDAAILFLALTGSVVPLLWMLARGKHVTQDDVLYALQLWKYYAVFLIVGATVRSERQVRACLWIAMTAASLVGLVAILESMNVLGVSGLLSQYYGVEGADRRGASTLGSPHAVAGVMVISLAIAAGWLIRGGVRRTPVVLLATGFVFGLIASGEISGYLGLLVGAAAVGLITGRLGRTFLALTPALALAGLALRSVIAARLSGFRSETGIPQSWEARLENLRTFFWPELSHHCNWILGVRPSARIRAPETWRDWVWIESGHTYLLWAGGVPFLAAFVVFLWVTLRRVGRVARERADAIGVAAIASFTGLVLVAVLMTFDPHLTLRGEADLNFALLALALTGGAGGQPARGKLVAGPDKRPVAAPV